MMPIPNPTYIVLPAEIKTGQTIILFKTDDYVKAEREALRLTACLNVQHIIYTSYSYTEKFDDLPALTIDALVYPFPVITPEV